MVLDFFEIDIEGQCSIVTTGNDKLEEFEIFAPLISNLIIDELDADLFEIPTYERTEKVEVRMR